MVTLLAPTDVTLPACIGPNRPGPRCPSGPAYPPGPWPFAAYDAGPFCPADGEDADAPKVTARTPPTTWRQAAPGADWKRVVVVGSPTGLTTGPLGQPAATERTSLIACAASLPCR